MAEFNLEEYAKRANEKWGGKYDYVEWKRDDNGKPLVGIICHEKDKYGREHGLFWKRPSKHMCGQGCPRCSGRSFMNNEYFIETAKLAHTSEFDNLSYEKTVFKGYKDKVIVTCRNKNDDGTEHGDFEITAGHLLGGQGCPICRYIKSSTSKRKSADETIEELMKIYPEYDYSKAKEGYIGRHSKIKVICHKKDKDGNEHGEFMMMPSNTLNPYLCNGCPKCGRERTIDSKKKDSDVYLAECAKVHNGFYDYSQTEYRGSNEYIYPICPIHGVFRQKAANHHMGQGCPLCASEKSKLERDITDFVKSLVGEGNVVENDREVLDGMEIDILVPSMMVGFEVDGLIWHSEKFSTPKDYHLNKMEKALSKGIRLINIFEDEWNEKKEIVKSRIRNILGFTERKIYARKCEIRAITHSQSKEFMNHNHIQGYAVDSIRYGLFNNDELVAVMTFGKKRINVGSLHSDGEYELIRFCNKIDTTVVGGASRLFSHFLSEYKPRRVVSYCDRRWSVGGLYERLGFREYNVSPPSYFYTTGRKRINRFSLRKDVLVEKHGCPKEMTEHEWCLANGFYRIYDCGAFCYEWNGE